MKKTLLIILFLILPCSITLSQTQFNFHIDYALFKYDSTSNFVEIYYSFPSNQLSVIEKDGKNILEGLLELSIVESNTKKIFLNKKWRIPSPVVKTNAKVEKNLVGILTFVIPKGNYECFAIGSDKNKQIKKRKIDFKINIKPYTSDKLSISNIQLASIIKNDDVDKNSIFYKNTLEIIPLPTDIYGINTPVLYYYTEIYNLDKDSGYKNLLFQTSIFNSIKQKIYSKKIKIKGNKPAIVQVGTVNVNKYPTGKYSIILSLSDSTSNFGIISTKEFFIFNPNIKKKVVTVRNRGGFLKSQFAVMSIEECDNLWERAIYIATENQQDQYEKISTIKGKREFLYTFWKSKDKDKSTTKNEYFESYLKRIRVAEKRFKSLGNKGWNSDMGRVFITYGEPDQVERFPNQSEVKPYEIWTYEQIESGVTFIFADLNGFSNYRLVHSTKRNEFHDQSWLGRIAID